MACSECTSPKEYKQEEKFYIQDGYRYYTRITFCEDCRHVARTERWSEKIELPKDPKRDKDW